MRNACVQKIIKEQEDPVVLRLALDQSRRDLTAAHAKLTTFHLEYDCVVPQVEFDRVELKVLGLEEANNVLTRENDELTEEGKRSEARKNFILCSLPLSCSFH